MNEIIHSKAANLSISCDGKRLICILRSANQAVQVFDQLRAVKTEAAEPGENEARSNQRPPIGGFSPGPVSQVDALVTSIRQ
jgi:hypothetical protein